MEMKKVFHFEDTEIRFLGAAGEVTGSKTLLKVNNRTILVDCGLFQGEKSSREKNWAPLPQEVDGIDAILITHAHLDHCGYLPRLVRQGYRGPIYCSAGTKALMKVILMDSAHLQEEDAEFANRSGYSNHKPAEPLYTLRDVDQTLPLIKVLSYHNWQTVLPGIEVSLSRSGHIIGSTVMNFRIKGKSREYRIAFSGDLGHDRQETIRGPEALPETDCLILESTYGDRVHPEEAVKDRLAAIIRRVQEDQGVLVIPAFAVGRAQEVLFLIRLLEDEGLIRPMPTVLDSPMAQEATRIYLEHPEDHPPNLSFERKSRNFFPKHFEACHDAKASFEIQKRRGPLIILSASGMLQGGRVLHHLKTRLPDERNAVLFVGYQAEGTKGWFLKNKGKSEGYLRIHHEPIPVRAHLESMDSLSAHGDSKDLISWVQSVKTRPIKIILNHGAPSASRELAKRMELELGIKADPVG
jgi:metallo-beta-lactamase family protein